MSILFIILGIIPIFVQNDRFPKTSAYLGGVMLGLGVAYFIQGLK